MASGAVAVEAIDRVKGVRLGGTSRAPDMRCERGNRGMRGDVVCNNREHGRENRRGDEANRGGRGAERVMKGGRGVCVRVRRLGCIVI